MSDTAALVFSVAAWLAMAALITEELAGRRRGRVTLPGLAGLLIFETSWPLQAISHLRRYPAHTAKLLDAACLACGTAGRRG